MKILLCVSIYSGTTTFLFTLLAIVSNLKSKSHVIASQLHNMVDKKKLLALFQGKDKPFISMYVKSQVYVGENNFPYCEVPITPPLLFPS